MRYIFFLLLLFIGVNIQAQATNFPFFDYYQHINQAELKIIKNDYESALAFYQQAFESVEHPFSRDYYNAAVCATLLKDKKVAVDYLEKLIAKGMTYNHLDTIVVFEKLKKSKSWKQMKANVPNLKQQYETTINQTLKKRVYALADRHEAYRHYVGYFNNVPRLDTVHTEIANEFFNLLDEYGFPDEQLIGIAENHVYPPFFSILYTHCDKRSYDYDRKNMMPIIMEAIRKGQILPSLGIRLIAAQKETVQPKYRVAIYGVYDKEEWLIEMEETMTKKHIATVDENRKQLGLSTFEEKRQKAYYLLTNPTTPFLLPSISIRKRYYR